MKEESREQVHNLVSLDQNKHGVNRKYVFFHTNIHAAQRRWNGVTKEECLRASKSEGNSILSTLLSVFSEQQNTKSRDLFYYTPVKNPKSFGYLLASKVSEEQGVDGSTDVPHYNLAAVDGSVELSLSSVKCFLAVLSVAATCIFLNTIVAATLAVTFLLFGAYEMISASSNMAKFKNGLNEELANLDEGAKINMTL